MKRPLLLVILVMAMLLAMAPAVSAREAGGSDVKGGFTLLQVKASTANALADAGVKVSAVPPAGGSSASFVFPVAGGTLSADPLGGRILHSGGLKFAAGNKSLTVKNFIINLNRGVLTARVVGGPRVPLLALDGGDVKVVGGRLVILRDVKASLTPEAAAALNDTLGTDAFAGGLPVGQASSVVFLPH